MRRISRIRRRWFFLSIEVDGECNTMGVYVAAYFVNFLLISFPPNHGAECTTADAERR